MILFHREAFSRWNMYLVGVVFLLAYDIDVYSLSRGQISWRFLTINQADTPKTAQADPGQGCGAKRSTRKA
jgi:hypothetical protein